MITLGVERHKIKYPKTESKRESNYLFEYTTLMYIILQGFYDTFTFRPLSQYLVNITNESRRAIGIKTAA